MTLLRDIQDSAIDSSVPLTTLLRKCKVLSARLKSDDFKQWIDLELNGYPDKDLLPPYRIIRVNSKGHFLGLFQSELRNGDIPLMCIDEKFRESLAHAYMMEPISAMEALVANSDSGTAMEPWNPDLVAHVGEKIYKKMNCIQAWKVIPITSVVAAIDAVRTRILNFVLEIEAEAPDAGEAPPDTAPVPQDRVTQIFNTHISGEVQNVSTGGTHFSQNATKNADNRELFDQLLSALTSSGAPAEEISRLTETVEEMRDARCEMRAARKVLRNITTSSCQYLRITHRFLGRL